MGMGVAVIAVTASGAALWITAYLGRHASHRSALEMLAAIVMGCAIVGMHYSGMQAAQFPIGSICGAANVGVDTHWLSILVTIMTLGVLAIALIVTVLDNRHASHTGKLNLSLHKANQALEHMALHDALTHLPNRALLEDRIEQARQTALRNNFRFSVLLMDLDGFKAVNANAEEHLQLVQDLRRAVEQNELVLHYQPKFDNPAEPVKGAEALVRWQHPRHGLVMPDDFIPTAEKNRPAHRH